MWNILEIVIYFQKIQVEFEGRNPTDEDFHGIKQLLQQLFLKAHINLSELAELIIGQSYVGSVVKVYLHHLLYFSKKLDIVACPWSFCYKIHEEVRQLIRRYGNVFGDTS